ncbi:MAG TPA: hypothetical protein VFZ08_14380, partial [Terriglobia bacterium]|nr:hypothetical protein [Terriglobia bacterium]
MTWSPNGSTQKLAWSSARWGAVAAALVILCCASAHAQNSQLAPVPPMGWNTWYAFGCHITETSVRIQADQMVKNGMKAAGYDYVNLDDCWQGARDAQG